MGLLPGDARGDKRRIGPDENCPKKASALTILKFDIISVLSNTKCMLNTKYEKKGYGYSF